MEYRTDFTYCIDLLGVYTSPYNVVLLYVDVISHYFYLQLLCVVVCGQARFRNAAV
jgi:hypothetical protein